MIFSPEIARKLEILVNSDVEKAIILLLDHVLKEKESVYDDPEATDAQLREFKGQKVLVSELKQYRNRLKDTIIREKERKQDVILNQP
jgi:hypothetical protein